MWPNFPRILFSPRGRSTATFLPKRCGPSPAAGSLFNLTNQIAAFGSIEELLSSRSWLVSRHKTCTQGFSRVLSLNLRSICLEIWLVSPKPIVIEFLGKRISLHDWRKDIRNRNSIELDSLLEHPWLYWVTHVTYKSNFGKIGFLGVVWCGNFE